MTCTRALRGVISIKTSVTRRPPVISVPAAATAQHPPTRSNLACRARTPRVLVLCLTRLALFVPRLHTAPRLPPSLVRARQAHSTRFKVNRSAPAVRLVNTAVRALQHALCAHPVVTATERVSLSARRVHQAAHAVRQAQPPQRLVPQVSTKAKWE